MKKYAYVISERLQRVTYVDFTEHCEFVYTKYNGDDDFEPGTICSYNESILMIFYGDIKDIIKYFSEEDVIISSDLSLPEVYERLNVPEWDHSFDVFFEMLKSFSKLTEYTEVISLEDLIEVMQ